MTYVTDPADTRIGPSAPRARPFARMIGGLLDVLGPREAASVVAPPPATGPAVAALIDADYERMASHGSWESLRDSLRASASPPARKSA